MAKKSIKVRDGDTEVSLPHTVLRDFGCRQCVWKQHHQCPKGYTTPSQGVKKGWCQEMEEFLFELRRTSTSLSGMKEKFFLYSQELVAQADRTKFHELQRKHDELLAKKPLTEEQKAELGELRMAIHSYKLWWSRLTIAIVKGLSRVSDREERADRGRDEAPKPITVQQLNVLIQDARQYLEENPDEKPETTKVQPEL